MTGDVPEWRTEILEVPAGRSSDAGASVPADSRHGVDLTVAVADDDDGLAGDVGGDEVAGVRQVLLASDTVPLAGEQGRLLESEELFAHVGPGRRRARCLDVLRACAEVFDERPNGLIHGRHGVLPSSGAEGTLSPAELEASA
jgi:hypothetical protein